jgi:hypothetical protein
MTLSAACASAWQKMRGKFPLSSTFQSAWKYVTATPARRFALGATCLVTAAPCIAIVQASVLLRDFRRLHGHAPVPITPSRGVVVAVRNHHHNHDDDDDDDDDDEYDDDDAAIDDDDDAALSTTTTTTTTTASTESGRFKYALDAMRKRLAQGAEYWHHEVDPSESDNRSGSSSTSNTTESSVIVLDSSLPPPLRILVIGDSLAAGVGVSQNATPILPEMIARTLSQKLHGRPVYWTCIGTPGANVTRIVQDIESYQENGKELLVRHSSLIRPSDSTVTDDTAEQLAIFPNGTRLKTWWKDRPTRVRKAIQRLEDNKQNDENVNNNNNNNSSDKNTTLTNLVTAPKKKLQLWSELLQSDWLTLQEAWRGSASTGDNDPRSVGTPKKPAVVELPPMDPFQLWQKWKQRLQRRTDTTVVGHYDVAIVLTGLNDLKEAVLPSFMVQSDGNNSKNKNNNSFGSSSSSTVSIRTNSSSSQSPPAASQQDAATINQESDETTKTTKKATSGLKDELERVLKALQNRMKLALDGRGAAAAGSSRGANDAINSQSSINNDSSIRSSSDVPAKSEEAQQATPRLVKLSKRSDNKIITTPGQDASSILSILPLADDDKDPRSNSTVIDSSSYIRRRPLVVFPALPASAAPVFQSPPLSWFAMPLIRRVDA